MTGKFSFDLSGRTALVTGASSGIGRRFALLLSASGANVAVAARRMSLLEDLCEEIEVAGGRAVAVTMDSTDEASTQAAYDVAENAFGTVDTVVANAGVSHAGSSLGLDIEDFDFTLDVNLRGVFLTAREGARRMVANNMSESGKGRVVLTGSVTGHNLYGSLLPYSTSKAAVEHMGRLLAKEWVNKGVNVNTIAPGYMVTEMTSDLVESGRGKGLIESFPRKRMMDVSALDALLLYLCSDESWPITGQVFTIDDGQTL